MRRLKNICNKFIWCILGNNFYRDSWLRGCEIIEHLYAINKSHECTLQEYRRYNEIIKKRAYQNNRLKEFICRSRYRQEENMGRLRAIEDILQDFIPGENRCLTSKRN